MSNQRAVSGYPSEDPDIRATPRQPSEDVYRTRDSLPASIAGGHGLYTSPAYLDQLRIAKGPTAEPPGWPGPIGAMTARAFERQLQGWPLKDAEVEYRPETEQISRLPGLGVPAAEEGP